MARAFLHFAPRDVRVEQFRYVDEKFVALAQAAYKAGQYVRHAEPITVLVGGEAAAEEIFDLTNNPSRENERWMRYGNGRSLSSGDIVEVEGDGAYLCLSVGWRKLA